MRLLSALADVWKQGNTGWWTTWTFRYVTIISLATNGYIEMNKYNSFRITRNGLIKVEQRKVNKRDTK